MRRRRRPRFRSLCLCSEAMFRAGEQATDVAAVTSNDQRCRDQQRKKDKWMLKAPEPEKYGESSRSENRSQGNVSGKRDNQQKDSERDCNWDRSNCKERAYCRGNAFPTMKAKPQWEHVSDDCKQRRKS